MSYANIESFSLASGAGNHTARSNMLGQQQLRRPTESRAMPPYQPSLPRAPSPRSMELTRTSQSSIVYHANSCRPSPIPSSGLQGYAYLAVHSPLPGTSLGINIPSHPPPPLYPSNSYGNNGCTTLPTASYPSITSPAPYPSYGYSTCFVRHSVGPAPGSTTPSRSQTSGPMPRILNTKAKPQCWDHSCNGRQFSTFSNLLRHQREKSGMAAKSYCPRCGAEFTRPTARTNHMAHEKCIAPQILIGRR
ncbi:hypothetical protein PMIN03_012674 [Paraphaeosphaeria minitans]